jgi:hypothetical protein
MRGKLLKSMIGIRKGENLRNKETGQFYVVKRLQEDTVALESRNGEGEILVTRTDIKTMYTKTLGTKLCNVFRAPVFWITIVSGPLFFLSVYLYLEAAGKRNDAFEALSIAALQLLVIALVLPLQYYAATWIYRLLRAKLPSFSRNLIIRISIVFWLLEIGFVYLAFTSHSTAEDLFIALTIQIYLLLSFSVGLWIYKLIVWASKKI